MEMKVNVNATNLDIFNDLAHILKEVIADIRIPEDVKSEYKAKLLAASTSVDCPHCNHIQTLNVEQYKELEQAEKVVVECNECNKLYVVRYDDNGNTFSHD